MAGPGEFVKQNIKENTAGKLGKGFVAFDIANLVTSQNKLKALWQIIKDIIFLRPIMAAGFAGLFLGMGRAIRSLVHDTGSLEAALKKLSQIQSLQKVFAPLVGGANAAKLKVAELVNFAASKNIKLADAGDAARSLMLHTKGLFDNARALETVNDAAKATGNSVVDMADAVGEFSDALSSGDSIKNATEQLRKMGAISNTTATALGTLQDNGASAGQIFTTLTTSLEQFHGGAEKAANDIDAINESYDKAQTNLQEKFGSPWIASDVVITKNMTSAMNGVAPAVERVSGVLSILFNGFSTFKSAVAKAVAGSGVFVGALEILIYALTAVVTIASAVGAVSLVTWFAAGATAAQGMGMAILYTTGMMASMFLIAGVVLGIGIQLAAAFDRESKALLDLARAHNEANAAIAQQIKDVRTLAERHQALAKSMDAVTAAQDELTAATKTFKAAKIAEAEANLAIAQKNARHAAAINPANLPPVEERLQANRDRIKREIAQKEERFQAEMSVSTPERQARLLAKHAAESEEKAKRGATGEAARVKFAEKAEAASIRVTDRQKKLEQARAALGTAEAVAQGPFKYSEEFTAKRDAIMQRDAAKLEVQAAEQSLKNAQANQAAVGSNATRGTSVQLESAQRAMLLSNDPERAKKAADIGLAAERARQNEAMRGENELIALKDREAAKAIERETRLNKIAIQRELDMQDAQVKMDTDRQQGLKDLTVFADKYQELLSAGYSAGEAKDLAGKFADNAIALNAQEAQVGLASAAVADSLTRIGGGGGVYAPGGDQMLTLAQRTNQLHEEELQYLKEMAEAGKSSGVL